MVGFLMDFWTDLEKIIRINSYTGNKRGVDAVGDCFRNWCAELGMSEQFFLRDFIGNHRLFKSTGSCEKKLLLVGHLDTVFPPDEFETYTEDDEWIYGPGVCDMKGGLMVAMQALRNVYEVNGTIEGIDLYCVSDEETGSDDSHDLTMGIAKEYDTALVFEAAGEHMEVVTGRKGLGTWNINIEGKAAHAGNHYSDGNDANLEAAYKLQQLVAMTDIAKGTTVNVGKITGGIGANTISPTANLLVEMRFCTADERDRVLTGLKQIVDTVTVEGVSATVTGRLQRDVMEETASQKAFLKRLENITADTIPSEFRGGGSDANIICSAGTAVLDGFGPFGDGDHTPHERALKSSFDERIKLTTTILKYHQQHGQI